MPSPNSLLNNPFAKDSWQSTYGLKPPSVKVDDSINIQTTKPILELNPTTGKKITFEKNQALKDFESRQKLNAKIVSDKANMQQEKTNWWSKQAKTTKGLIIVGSLAVVGTIVYLVIKNRK